MDWSAIGTLITTVGFPIVACILMGVYVKYITDQQRCETKELNAQHTQEMLAFKDEMKDALNNNTLALQKLCDKLDRHTEV
jgi:hypothetical protein